jgi:threonyl-tRNA synthetase
MSKKDLKSFSQEYAELKGSYQSYNKPLKKDFEEVEQTIKKDKYKLRKIDDSMNKRKPKIISGRNFLGW